MGSAVSTVQHERLNADEVRSIVGAVRYDPAIFKLIRDKNNLISREQLEGEIYRFESTITPIRFIHFNKLKSFGAFPRFPENKEMCENYSEIDLSNSFVVYVSHTWLRGSKLIPGWDGRPHPDNQTGDKYRLCVEGIEKAWRHLAPGMQECYIWVDFSCVHQDREPGVEMKQLDEIITLCDIIFTPLVGSPMAVPIGAVNWYQECISESWNGPEIGYVNRAWCRLEMFYAANMPLVVDVNRVGKLTYGLRHFASFGIRPHLLYGSLEKECDMLPTILPPLRNLYFDLLHPNKGFMGRESDRVIISRWVEDLGPKLTATAPEVGYKGGLDSEGHMHGPGEYSFDNGDIYTGDYVHGKMHGSGKYMHANGDVYVGEFFDGQRSGRGKFCYASGSEFEGDYLLDERSGEGRFSCVSGLEYIGSYVGSFMHGQGSLTYANGDRYVGAFHQGELHGLGTMTCTDGYSYVGEWRFGLKEGRGRAQWMNSNCFEGDFSGDKMRAGRLWVETDAVTYEARFSAGSVVDGVTVFNVELGTDLDDIWLRKTKCCSFSNGCLV